MKTLLTIVGCLALAVSFSYGQRGVFRANDDTLLVARTYTTATVDTTAILDVRTATAMSVAIGVRDIARLYIGYQTSTNKSTWSGINNYDSIATSTTAGGHRAVDFSTIARGVHYIRFIVRASIYGTQGTTTPTYDFTYGIVED